MPTAAPYGSIQNGLLDGLIAADDALRAIAPIIAQRVRPPYFRPLRPVLVPRPRIEIAERLVLHLVHLAEELDAHLIGVAVIDRDIVADDVAARPPDQMDVVTGERLGGALDFRPVLDLERDVVELRLVVVDEIDGVVVGIAAQEGERVVAPVGDAEAEHVAIEFQDRKSTRL